MTRPSKHTYTITYHVYNNCKIHVKKSSGEVCVLAYAKYNVRTMIKKSIKALLHNRLKRVSYLEVHCCGYRATTDFAI